MSSSDDDNDDLFADSDSDDTADLIKASATAGDKADNKKKRTTTAPKKRLQKKKSAADEASKRKKQAAAAAAAKAKPAADSDLSSDSDDGDLFDSSDSDGDDGGDGEPDNKKNMSKRERLEALAATKRGRDSGGGGGGGGGGAGKSNKKKPPASDPKTKQDRLDTGYDSGDSYDSGNFQRTAEDDAFLDTTGEDADAVNELYADQHFDDERPDWERPKKGKKRKNRYDENGDRIHVPDGDEPPDNPIMAAVHRMKKKKRERKGLDEMEAEINAFLLKMDEAADSDEVAISERRPATKKLSSLNEVLDVLAKRDMQRHLLDFDLLSRVDRWVKPLRSGKLGNVTVRQRLLEAVGNMSGTENGVSAQDLKRSGLGRTVMTLYKHRDETPTMKRQLKSLIEKWSRPIFQKSGNMRDLERVHGNRGEGGLAALSRQQQYIARQMEQQQRQSQQATGGRRGPANDSDLQSMIATGKMGSADQARASANRVRVPFSKGFSYQIRPEARANVTSKESDPKDGGRSKLKKRMLEKSRTISKNQRSANISIEGRRTKG